MKTIRMPRRMGEITERLPAPQYDQPTFKRTNSQPQMRLDAIDTNVHKKLITSSESKTRPSAPASGAARNTDVNQTSKLNLGGKQIVEVESKSLIKKAHELHNIINSQKPSEKKQDGASLHQYSTPEKSANQPLSLADRAARINNELNYELPAIEEAADKENDTFATGGPIAALQLAAKRREANRLKQRESQSNNSSRINTSQDRSHLRSAEPSVGSAKKDQYRMYREAGDKNSIGIGNLARNALPPRSRISYASKNGLVGESQTPAYQPAKATDLINNQVKNDKVSLPRIQSSRSNHLTPSVI